MWEVIGEFLVKVWYDLKCFERIVLVIVLVIDCREVKVEER